VCVCVCVCVLAEEWGEGEGQVSKIVPSEARRMLEILGITCGTVEGVFDSIVEQHWIGAFSSLHQVYLYVLLCVAVCCCVLLCGVVWCYVVQDV